MIQIEGLLFEGITEIVSFYTRSFAFLILQQTYLYISGFNTKSLDYKHITDALIQREKVLTIDQYLINCQLLCF